MKIAIDCDGVIANFYAAYCDLHGMPHETVTGWDVDWIDDSFMSVNDNHEFWATLPVLNGPSAIGFDFDYYITAIDDHLGPARIQWIKNNGFPDKPVILSFDKVKTMKKLGITVLVDDKLKTIKEVHAAGLIGIQYVPYYMNPNEVHHHNIRNLHDVNKILKEI